MVSGYWMCSGERGLQIKLTQLSFSTQILSRGSEITVAVDACRFKARGWSTSLPGRSGWM